MDACKRCGRVLYLVVGSRKDVFEQNNSAVPGCVLIGDSGRRPGHGTLRFGHAAGNKQNKALFVGVVTK